MSEFVFNRRDFLKLAGVGAAGTLAGCSTPPAERLIPYVIPPTDVLPGIPYWYASTCRECAAGCGILVKQREGRAIKLEGNPAHPLGRGGVCSRGHAALQGLYHPDRLRTPMLKKDGAWAAVTWDEAMAAAGPKLADARTEKTGVALLSGHDPGTFRRLAGQWAGAFGGTHVAYEAFAHESLREANRRSFGRAEVPHHDFAAAQVVITFGADFLETWLSPVGYARDFAAMRARPESYVVAVEPRLSLTGSNADEWLAAKPGSEVALALGLAHVIVRDGLGAAGAASLRDALGAWTPAAVEKATDIPAATVEALAKRFAAARPGLAVAGGVAAQSAQSVALLTAVNLLNWVAGNVNRTVRFDRALDYDGVASFAELQSLIARMDRGEIDVLVVTGTNPAYTVPGWAGFPAAMGKVAFKVALASTMDETAELCDLVLPLAHPLESLGDAENARGVHSLVQPTMQRVPAFDSRPAGEALLALAAAGGAGERFPATWTEVLQARWRELHARFGGGRDFDTFWHESLQRGGVFEEPAAVNVTWNGGVPDMPAPVLGGAGDVTLVLTPTLAFHDGRGADKPWLQELPDPVTKVVWGSWAEIHPDTAKALGVAEGDAVVVTTEAGKLEVPAYLTAGVRRDVVALPLGQGRTAGGRYATGRGVNPLALLPAAQDAASGAVAYLATHAKLAKGTAAVSLSMTQREKRQHDRGVAQLIPVSALTAGNGTTPGAGHGAEGAHGISDHHETSPTPLPGGHGLLGHGEGAHEIVYPGGLTPGKDTEPRARTAQDTIPAHAISAFEPHEKARAPRQIPVHEGDYGKATHRWAMAIDLNACNGCSACVTACHAENNIPTVGPAMIQRGREMSWIRIERFEERIGGGANDVRHIPMMCQHCSDAPCETVCPVYATYHNPEGLNAQVYNRCVGTRYCSNNCPYKARSFNFFDYAAPEKPTFAFPEPLNWQLNPDVTVRSKGVMEKCTMCVQRILEGKGVARDESRALRDGEIQTACSQSCPTQAIVFGDLLDPESHVAKLSHGDRRYWVFSELNTRPGVTYLRKIGRGAAEEKAE